MNLLETEKTGKELFAYPFATAIGVSRAMRVAMPTLSLTSATLSTFL
jgi:hypothetical protein